MTPREIDWFVDAVWHERNRQLEMVAQLACWVLSPFSNKPLRVRDLLRRSKKTKRKETDD
jgi:hypothetical protein